MKPASIAAHLFEETIYNRPHTPQTEETRIRWQEVEALKNELCGIEPQETVGLITELMQALELYHACEKRDAYVLGFKAGGQAMQEILGG